MTRGRGIAQIARRRILNLKNKNKIQNVFYNFFLSSFHTSLRGSGSKCLSYINTSYKSYGVRSEDAAFVTVIFSFNLVVLKLWFRDSLDGSLAASKWVAKTIKNIRKTLENVNVVEQIETKKKN